MTSWITWKNSSVLGRQCRRLEGLAVILHTLHIFTGKVVSFQDGEFIEVQAGSGKEIVAFPAPLGKITVFHLGHPEPVTLPRYLPGVRRLPSKEAWPKTTCTAGQDNRGAGLHLHGIKSKSWVNS